MPASASLVGPSRDGDQFHYHWAARQCLGLLPGGGDLVAVTIEGSSPEESQDSIPEGEELIDVGMYYGAAAFNDARLVRYVQLKHSTRHPSEPWTASGLQRTVRGFAMRYRQLREHFSFAELRPKLRFEFTTNRPIASQLSEALEDLVNAVTTRHPRIRGLLEGYAALDGMLTAEFFRLLSVEGSEPGLWAQRELLAQDFGGYLAEADYDAPLQLKELVTRKAIFGEPQYAAFDNAGYDFAVPSGSDVVLGYAYPAGDADNDNLPDAVEYVIGTSSAHPDSDGDGSNDGAEYPLANVPGSDPCSGSINDCTVPAEIVFGNGFE